VWGKVWGVIVHVSVKFRDPMTASVSVISGAQDDAAVGVGEVCGCTKMIAECRTD
jgi:hypothetical protein